MPSILGANSVSGYEVSNSLRFNEADDSKLSFDPDDAGNVDTMTISFWFKPDLNFGGDHNNIISVRPSSGSYSMLVHRSSGEFNFEQSGVGDVLKTNRKFRDPSAWYHIVLALDSTNGTAAQRVRLYVNGVEETSFATDNRSSVNQNADFLFGGGNPHQIGGDPTGNYFYGGYLAEFNYVNGAQKVPTDFGKFDDNGVWIPIKYTGAYGTNGFFLEFKQTGTSANASGIGADTSGQGNHFTPTNLAATDITTDTCTNNFATLNPLTQSEPGNLQTFAEGNCKITMANFDVESVMATMGVQNGKWYWEVKGGWKTSNWGFGIEKASSSNVGLAVGYTATSYSFSQNGYKQNNSNASQIDNGLSDGDIIGYALDLDNGYFNFSQNGTWYNGSASESTTFNTGNHDFSSLDFGSEFVMPTISGFGDSSITTEINFGQPTFTGTDKSDANGYGSFEYAPPSGYYALCTKNLAEFG